MSYMKFNRKQFACFQPTVTLPDNNDSTCMHYKRQLIAKIKGHSYRYVRATCEAHQLI
jgi:hypothetical protein